VNLASRSRTRRCPQWVRLVLAPGLLAFASLVSLAAGTLQGGSFTLTATPTGGGGRVGSAAYTVEGAVGQMATGKSNGGSYQLSGGILGVVVVPGEVTVTVETTGDGQARLTWPANAVGFQLQFAEQLGPSPDWKTVLPAPTGNTFVTPMDQPLRFFRLHKP